MIAFVSETPELLVMEDVWPPADSRTPPHAHPKMEERWTVLEGCASFRIGDEPVVEASAGETVVAPAGVRHVAWNPGPDTARVRIEMRPALRWREFVERLGAGEDVATLLRAFPDEIAL